ncbi:hypothetical protein C0995_016538 [Termitomyces sp. Mi166|nr:hypothetical protein C0995_016538 [Termitomyces sp. Mi166\
MATILQGQARPERSEFRQPMSISIPHPCVLACSLAPRSKFIRNIDSSEDEAPVPHTEAEKAREKKLLQDSMVVVLSPHLVRCRTCGTNIKLSMKSLFDGYHWRTHRTRCLKKIGMSVSPAPKTRIPKFSRGKRKPQANLDILRLRPLSRPNSEEPDTRARTPSLEQDSERDSIPVSQASPLRYHDSSSPPSSMMPLPDPDAVFEEYFFRTHGKRSQPSISTHWQDWSWDQLLLPRFVLDLDFVPRMSLEEDDDDDGT